jgi:hypothetical protein
MQTRSFMTNLGPVLLAFALAFIAGYVNLHNDEVQPPLFVILVSSFLLGAARPQLAWLWGIIFGSAVPVSYYVSNLIGYTPPYPASPGTEFTFLIILPALAAAYFGALVRKLASEALGERTELPK